MLSVECKAICIGINFLVLLSILLCSSLVQFKKGPEYFTMEIDQVLIPFLNPKFHSNILAVDFNSYYNAFQPFFHTWSGLYFLATLYTCNLLYYYYYCYLWRVFHISWWFFTGVWVTVSFLNSPGLFLVFWPISVM